MIHIDSSTTEFCISELITFSPFLVYKVYRGIGLVVDTEITVCLGSPGFNQSFTSFKFQ
uniref:Uncharacterized protein n=1 Tax=Arundo donax TaxID=35708 RepID=A0A0A9U1P3_ARUDO